MGTLLFVLALLILGLGIFVRLAPSNPSQWHLDPGAVSVPKKPNFDLMRPQDGSRAPAQFSEPPEALLQRLNAVALAEPRVSVLAGSPAEGQITYIARSALWGFPDYVSVKAVDDGAGGSQLLAFSRARFGYSDMGVNGKRMTAWLAALGA